MYENDGTEAIPVDKRRHLADDFFNLCDQLSEMRGKADEMHLAIKKAEERREKVRHQLLEYVAPPARPMSDRDDEW